MRKSSVILGKTVLALSRLRGGGSALPGLVIEKIDKNFLSDSLDKLPKGVVVVSGTNGKTTTTKMVTELFESQGLKVFTNKTGSNFTRGVVSAILADTKKFKFDYDIAVIELDEAHAVKFVEQVKPDYTLLLNVLRDQLDRFGEIDVTAKLLTEVAKNTKKTVVLNREDPLIASIANSLSRNTKIVYYGYSAKLASYFPNDDDLYKNKKIPRKSTKSPLVELQSFSNNKVNFKIEQKSYTTEMAMSGVYNYLNAAGALATVLGIDKQAKINSLLQALSKTKAAFGRGEKFDINGATVELILVKNPAGFRSSLQSQYSPSSDTMIAINDQYADGRDMSWLWDVDFTILKQVSVVSGIRAYDMALRLQYDSINPLLIETDIKKAVSSLLNKPSNKQIFTTYTAMLEIRKILSKLGKTEGII